ncbi:MAG: radical SAM protein [Paraclostridium sp.]
MKTLILTRDCSLSCNFCYQGSDKKKQYMTKETIDKIMLESKEEKFFSIFGGEPFMHKELLNYICEKYDDKKYMFTTNVIDTDISILKKYKEKGLIYGKIILSLDPINVNCRYGEKDNDFVIDKVKEILELFRNSNIKINLNSVILSKDFNNFFNTYKYYKEISKDYINANVNINFETSEIIEDKFYNILFESEIPKIIKYDLDNFDEIKFNMLKRIKFKFCEGFEAYDFDGKKSGCHHDFFEKRGDIDKIKQECFNCKNEYCVSCLFTNFTKCSFYKKLSKYMEVREWKQYLNTIN